MNSKQTFWKIGKIMEKLLDIINEWDPIGLFPMAPKDEYMNEAKKIYEYAVFNNVKVNDLAEFWYKQ